MKSFETIVPKKTFAVAALSAAGLALVGFFDRSDKNINRVKPTPIIQGSKKTERITVCLDTQGILKPGEHSKGPGPDGKKKYRITNLLKPAVDHANTIQVTQFSSTKAEKAKIGETQLVHDYHDPTLTFNDGSKVSLIIKGVEKTKEAAINVVICSDINMPIGELPITVDNSPAV